MSNQVPSTFEKIKLALFASPDERVVLSELEQAIRERYAAVLALMLDDPSMPQKNIVNFLMNTFNVQKSQAYIDIKACGALFGNYRMASEQWSKYLVIEANKMVIDRCQRYIAAIEKTYGEDEKGNIQLRAKDHAIINGYHDMIINATKIIGKYERLDKQDAEKPNWDDVKPPEFAMTDDISKLPEFNGKPLTAEQKRRLRDKYLKDIPEADIVDE